MIELNGSRVTVISLQGVLYHTDIESFLPSFIPFLAVENSRVDDDGSLVSQMTLSSEVVPDSSWLHFPYELQVRHSSTNQSSQSCRSKPSDSRTERTERIIPSCPCRPVVPVPCTLPYAPCNVLRNLQWSLLAFVYPDVAAWLTCSWLLQHAYPVGTVHSYWKLVSGCVPPFERVI